MSRIRKVKRRGAAMVIVALSLVVTMALGSLVTLAVEGSNGNGPEVRHTIGYSSVPVGYSIQVTYGGPDGAVEVSDGDRVPEGAEVTIRVARDEDAFVDYLREVLGNAALDGLLATGNVAGLADALPEDDAKAASLKGALEGLAQRSGNAPGNLPGEDGSRQPGGLPVLWVPGTGEDGMADPSDNRERVLALLLPESFGVRVNGDTLAGALPDFEAAFRVEADTVIAVEPRYWLGAAPMAYSISGSVITVDGHSHRDNADSPPINIEKNGSIWECTDCGTTLGSGANPSQHYQYECDVARWAGSAGSELAINFSGENGSLDPGITAQYLAEITAYSANLPESLQVIGDDPMLGINGTQPEDHIDLQAAIGALDPSAPVPALTVANAGITIGGTVAIPANYTVYLVDQEAGRISGTGSLEISGDLHVTGTPASGGVGSTGFAGVALTVDGGTVSGDSQLINLGAIKMTAGGSIGNHLASNQKVEITGGTVERGVTVETDDNSSTAVTISGGALIKGRVMATDAAGGSIAIDDATVGEPDHVATDDHEDGVVQANGGSIVAGATQEVKVTGGIIRSLRGDIDFRDGTVGANSLDGTRGRLEAWNGKVDAGAAAGDIHRINAGYATLAGTRSGNVISLVGGNNSSIFGAVYDYLFAAGPATAVTGSTITNAFAGPEYAPHGSLGDVDYRPGYNGSSGLAIGSGSTVENLYAGGRAAITSNGGNAATVTVNNAATAINNVYLGGDGPDGGTNIPTKLAFSGSGSCTVGNIYGGGTRGDGAEVFEATIDTTAGTVTGSIFGGYDNRDGTDASEFPAPYTDTGSSPDGGDVTKVTVNLNSAMAPSGADGGSIYGGGRVGGVKEAFINVNNNGQVGSSSHGGYVYGGSPGAGNVINVTIALNSGGTVMQDVYGGSASSGNVTTSVVNYNGCVIAGEHGIHGGGSGGETTSATVYINAGITRTGQFSHSSNSAHIYGGGSTGPVGTANIFINGTVGTANARLGPSDIHVFGGSRGSGAVENSTITLGGTTPGMVVGNVYGGSKGSGTVGSANIVIGGDSTGTVNGEVFGGGAVENGTGDYGRVGSVGIVVGGDSDGTVERNVHGGAQGSGHVETATITIGGDADGKVYQNVYGGAGSSATGRITGSTTIDIGTISNADGHVGGTVFGGGANTGAVAPNTNVNKATINFNQGTVGGDISPNATPGTGTRAAERWYPGRRARRPGGRGHGELQRPGRLRHDQRGYPRGRHLRLGWQCLCLHQHPHA